MPRTPPNNNQRKLTREGGPTQETEKGLEIPVPDKSEVMDLLDRAATKKPRKKPKRG